MLPTVKTTDEHIFISYREKDQMEFSERLDHTLRKYFGPDRVFFDKRSIAPGDKWYKDISNRLSKSCVLLVLIGPKWMDAKNDDGELRLFNSKDPVRFEIEQGLALGLSIIPVLIDDIKLPAKQSLPESLRNLVDYQAIWIGSGNKFVLDSKRLKEEIMRRILTFNYALRPVGRHRSGFAWFGFGFIWCLGMYLMILPPIGATVLTYLAHERLPWRTAWLRIMTSCSYLLSLAMLAYFTFLFLSGIFPVLHNSSIDTFSNRQEYTRKTSRDYSNYFAPQHGNELLNGAPEASDALIDELLCALSVPLLQKAERNMLFIVILALWGANFLIMIQVKAGVKTQWGIIAFIISQAMVSCFLFFLNYILGYSFLIACPFILLTSTALVTATAVILSLQPRRSDGDLWD